MLNLIFPRLVPAIITGVIYWLFGRKGMNSTKAILLIIVAAIAFSAFGHFLLRHANGVRYGKTVSIGQPWSLL